MEAGEAEGAGVVEPDRDDDLRWLLDEEAMDVLRVTFDEDSTTVSGFRRAAGEFLDELAVLHPASAPDARENIVLIVSELASNAVQFAPGPVTLSLRPTIEGVHVTMCDSSPVAPVGRAPSQNFGGLGWHLVKALAEQVSVVTGKTGKEIHAFLPW